MFKLTMYFMLWLSCIRLFSSKYFVCVLSVNIVLASTDSSLYSMCVCRCACVLRKEKPGHIPWGDRLRLISNALYERELSPLSDHLHLSSPFISFSPPLYSSFSFLLHLLTPPAHSLVFHSSGSPYLFSESIRISLWTGSPSLTVHVHGIQVKIEILALRPKQAPWLIIYL